MALKPWTWVVWNWPDGKTEEGMVVRQEGGNLAFVNPDYNWPEPITEANEAQFVKVD